MTGEPRESRQSFRSWKALDHVGQVDVSQTIAVVGKEHPLAGEVFAHGPQPLSDIAPHTGVDHGNAPILLRIAEDLDTVAELRDHTVRVALRPVVQKELLDDVRLIAKAQDEVLVAVLTVVVHQMPQDRAVADGDHRLGDTLGEIPDPGPKTSAEQYGLQINVPPLRESWRATYGDAQAR